MPAFALRTDWVPLLRLGYLLLAFTVTWAGVRLRQPRQIEQQAAVVAAGLQLIFAVLLDAAGQAAGLWKYTVHDGLVLGVPLDLHLSWALPWGVLFVIGAPRSFGSAFRYALVWWAATITFDALSAAVSTAVVEHAAGLGWLLGDAAMIAALLGSSLTLYQAVLRSAETRTRGPVAPSELPGLRRGAALRAGLYLAAFGALSFGFVPHLILSLTGVRSWPLPTPSPALSGILLAYVFLCLLWPLWAVAQFIRAGGTPLPFDPPLSLVISGPYAYVRNPMQAGAVLAMFGLAALYRSWGLLVYAVDLALLSQLLFLRHEEQELRRRFGSPYERYCAAVRCWIPRLVPYRSA